MLCRAEDCASGIDLPFRRGSDPFAEINAFLTLFRRMPPLLAYR